MKKLINSFAWWLYSYSKYATNANDGEIVIKVTVDSDAALSRIDEMRKKLENLYALQKKVLWEEKS